MTVTEERPASILGQRLLRREDPALLTGEAKFTNDLNVPGALHLALLRSPYAHARIIADRSVRGPRHARRRRGLHRFRPHSLWAGPMPCAWPVTADMKSPAHYPLAVDKAATPATAWPCVLATSDAAAPRRARRDRRHLRSAVTRDRSRGRAQRPSGDPRRSRHQHELHLGPQGRRPRGQVDEAFAAAAYTVSGRYVQQRLIPMAMEPRRSWPCRSRSAAT